MAVAARYGKAVELSTIVTLTPSKKTAAGPTERGVRVFFSRGLSGVNTAYPSKSAPTTPCTA